MRKATLFVLAAIGLVLVAQAGAHAEITPEKVPAGAVSTFVLSVEGEESAPTVKIAMQLPPGMANLKPATVRGWQVNLGGRVITWTGGSIAQGQTGEFEITAQFPNSPGKTLKFPVVQTYGNGTVVRWIGAPSSETPAPRIELTASAAPPPPPPPPQATTPTTTSTNAPAESDDDDGAAGWIIGGAVVLGLIAVGAALLWRRRR
jgi:periplasmic copper chaperone A